MKSLLNLRCHVLFDPTTEKNMHNTHSNPGLDNPFRLMLPICHSAFHCKVNQYRTSIPFNYTGRCIPKAQRGPLQNQVAAFQRYKIHFKKSLSLPHGNHWLSSIITRPHTTRFSGAHFFCSVYQKITTNYFVIFVDWFWRLELDLLKNHYKHLCGISRVSWRAILWFL